MRLPEPIFSLEMKVRDYEVDSEGIVNNAVYLHYLEHTRHEFCQQAGLSFRQMRERGMAPVVSHVDINYRTPLGLGETMTSLLALERRGPRFVFRQWIVNAAGALAVDAKIDIVNLENGRLSRGDTLAESFAAYL